MKSTYAAAVRDNRTLKYHGVDAGRVAPDYRLPDAAFQAAQAAAMAEFNAIEVLTKNGTTQKLRLVPPHAMDHPESSSEALYKRRENIARDAALAAAFSGGSHDQHVATGIQEYLRKFDLDVSTLDGLHGYKDVVLEKAKAAFDKVMQSVALSAAGARTNPPPKPGF